LYDVLISHKKLIEYDNSILPSSPMKAGEGNPQAREEEGKLSLLGTERSSSLAGIPWESHCFHATDSCCCCHPVVIGHPPLLQIQASKQQHILPMRFSQILQEIIFHSWKMISHTPL